MIPSLHCPKKPKSRPTNHNADWKTIRAKTDNSSQKHPYFPKNCKECGFNKNKGKITNWFRNAEKDCWICEYVNLPNTHHRDLQRKIKSYNLDEWDKSYISNDSGGFVVTQKRRIEEGKKSNNEKNKYEKELRMCMELNFYRRSVQEMRHTISASME